MRTNNFFLCIIFIFISCTYSPSEYLHNGDFNFWYMRNESYPYLTDIFYFDCNHKCLLFRLAENGHFEKWEGFDELYTEKWNIIGDTIIDFYDAKSNILYIDKEIMLLRPFRSDGIDTFRAAPRSMIPDKFYHRY